MRALRSLTNSLNRLLQKPFEPVGVLRRCHCHMQIVSPFHIVAVAINYLQNYLFPEFISKFARVANNPAGVENSAAVGEVDFVAGDMAQNSCTVS